MRLNQFVLPIAIGLALSACSEKDPVVQPQADSQPIALSASIDEGSLTGTRVASGTIEEGTYYLSFADPTNAEALQSVETLFENGIGYPWVYEAASGEGEAPQSYPLNWENVTTSGKSATFYLDNVETDETAPIIQLGEAYKASEYNAGADDQNDIVWGRLQNVGWNNPTLSFTLTHQMSRVRVEIGYEGVTPPTDPVYTVSLSSVKTIPASFNRTTGEVTPKLDETTSTITLLEEGDLTEGGNFTPSWILPPQTFTDKRPGLTIQVAAGGETTTYSGTLPAYMFPNTNTNTPTDDDDFEFEGEPEPLEFQAGKLLTIRVTLVDEVGNRDILFLPAVVEKWQNIGTIGGIISRQLGIYDEDDWEEVAIAYNEDPSESNATLKRFGTYSNGKWTIHVFANIGQDGDTFTKFKNNTNLNLIKYDWTIFGKTNVEDLIESDTEPDVNEGENQEPTTPDGGEKQTPIEGQEEQL